MDYRQSYIHAGGYSPSEFKEYGFLCSLAGRISFGAKIAVVFISIFLLYLISESGMHKSQGFMYIYVIGMGSFVSYLLYHEWVDYKNFVSLAS